MIKINNQQKNFVENEVVALATCDLDNKPNVIAVTHCLVVDNDKILVTDNFMNKTRKNLLENKKIALAVWNKNEEGYQFKGKAEYLIEGKWKDKVDNEPNNKNWAHKAAVLITVEKFGI
jgi:predicted pyridoxine 5'-phosphate oxidase superfamily flavin-nucleotide-binding protein